MIDWSAWQTISYSFTKMKNTWENFERGSKHKCKENLILLKSSNAVTTWNLLDEKSKFTNSSVYHESNVIFLRNKYSKWFSRIGGRRITYVTDCWGIETLIFISSGKQKVIEKNTKLEKILSLNAANNKRRLHFATTLLSFNGKH